MATINEIRTAAARISPMIGYKDTFHINPPLGLIAIRSNRTLHADAFADGSREMVRIVEYEDANDWFPVNLFTLAP